MRWQKRGLLYAPPGDRPWARTHATLPVTLPLHDAVCRVYFASRDRENHSHVGWVEADLAAGRVLRAAAEPVLAPGAPGHFDDAGVYAASLVAHGGVVRMYYIGWNVGAPAPMFYTAIGLAESEDGGFTFRKASRAPILDRSEHDPWMVSAPCVLLDGGTWRMWYISGLGWERVGGRLWSRYHLKYAESADGVSWRRDGRVAIPLAPGETNISRPCVRREGDRYRMWFAYERGAGYRVGYAESADGMEWTRRDEEAGLHPAADGWEGGAAAYPWVEVIEGRRYVLYNGAGFGRAGVGLAVEEPAAAPAALAPEGPRSLAPARPNR